MTFTIQNTFKIADILATEVSEQALSALKEHATTYKDQRLKEDIFNLSDILEMDGEEIPEAVMTEIGELQEALNEIDCSYVRIIYS